MKGDTLRDYQLRFQLSTRREDFHVWRALVDLENWIAPEHSGRYAVRLSDGSTLSRHRSPVAAILRAWRFTASARGAVGVERIEGQQ